MLRYHMSKIHVYDMNDAIFLTDFTEDQTEILDLLLGSFPLVPIVDQNHCCY
jgi:hypothetical protein